MNKLKNSIPIEKKDLALSISPKYSKYAPLLRLIVWNESKGSGLYDAARGSYKGPKITSLTIGQVMNLQKAGKIHAVGGFQMLRSTLEQGVRYLKINPNEKFTPNLQNKIAVEYIFKLKRPAIGRYLEGNSNVRSAASAMYLEWAVFKMGQGLLGKYDKITMHNRASVEYSTLVKALIETKNIIQKVKK